MNRQNFNHLALYLVLFAFLSVGFLDQAQAKSRDKETSQPQCPSGEHWVRNYDRKAYFRTDGARVKSSFVPAHCQQNPPSYAKWRDRIRDSQNSPEWAKGENRKRWLEEEKELVYEALSELPGVLLIDSVTALYRSKRSSVFAANPATGDSGFVTLYDVAFEKNRSLSRILAHEFAHELFRQIPDATRVDYAKSTGWKPLLDLKTGKYRFIPLRFEYVEEDGAESVTEDFANNVEYYLFEQAKLRKITPEAFKWLQKTFGDKLKTSRGVR